MKSLLLSSHKIFVNQQIFPKSCVEPFGNIKVFILLIPVHNFCSLNKGNNKVDEKEFSFPITKNSLL